MGVVSSLCLLLPLHSKPTAIWIRAMAIEDSSWVPGQHSVSPPGTLKYKTLALASEALYIQSKKTLLSHSKHQRNGAKIAGFILKRD